MADLKNYVKGRWEAGAVPTLRNAAASLRVGAPQAYQDAINDQMFLGAHTWNASLGSLSIFPSLEMYGELDDQAQQQVLNVLDSSNFFQPDGSLLMGAVYQSNGAWISIPPPEQPVDCESLQPAAPEPTLEEVEEVLAEQPDEPVAELSDIQLAAQEYYSRTIPNQDGWKLDRKRPFQLPLEAYADWKMAHGDLELSTDVLITVAELCRVTKAMGVSTGRLLILMGDEAGRKPPTDPRFQAFRGGGRKFFTSSTMAHAREACEATYKRRSWIRGGKNA